MKDVPKEKYMRDSNNNQHCDQNKKVEWFVLRAVRHGSKKEIDNGQTCEQQTFQDIYPLILVWPDKREIQKQQE